MWSQNVRATLIAVVIVLVVLCLLYAGYTMGA